jgi:hypothetical protein
MEGPGRKSVESLSVVVSLPGQRLEPPESLTDGQKATWRAVVATKPPEWFAPDSAPVLVAYCKAVESHGHLSRQVEKYEARKKLNGPALRSYSYALAAQEKQTKLIAMLATKMRLVQQSRYTTQSAATADRKTANAEKKPWDFGKAG